MKNLFILIAGTTATYSLWKLWKLYKRKNIFKNTFLIHRDIDPDCNGKPLSVGVMGNNKKNKNKQGIRWGDDGEIKSFVSFSNINHQRMMYHFEDSTTLTIYKGDDSDKVMYNFISPEIGDVNKEIDENYFGTLKPISMGETSRDLDEMFGDP